MDVCNGVSDVILDATMATDENDENSKTMSSSS